jgi:hypothetical protein
MQDRQHLIGQRHYIRHLALITFRRYRPNLLIEIELAPTSIGHITQSLSREHQHLIERAPRILLLVDRCPQFSQFLVGEHALARLLGADKRFRLYTIRR